MKSLLFVIFNFYHFLGFTQMVEMNDFGDNPGKLRSYIYVPKNLESANNIPLVAALHGCTQDASELANESGWNRLADQYGFIILYPEQKKLNNSAACFNWFSKSDIRFNGESESIIQMINYVQKHYSIDSTRIFSYGLSAGAAMTTALLAQYPETFQSGAVFAGGPYGIALNGIQAFGMMKDGGEPLEKNKEWAKPVKDLHKDIKRYPKIIIVQGQDDKTVNPINASNLVKQWLGLHTEINSEVGPIKEIRNKNITILNYVDTVSNEVVIKEYKITNLGHELPVDPGSNKNQGGQTGKYSKDIDFYSTYYIAQDFGLIPKD